MEKVNLQMLRRGAVIGLVLVLNVDFLRSTRLPNVAGLGLVMLLVLGVAVAGAAWWLMSEATGALIRHKDLLIPTALVLVLGKILTWLSAAPVLGALLNPSLPVHLFSLSLSISIGLVLHIALMGAYATWMTAVVLEFARNGQSDPGRTLLILRTKFWRGLGLLFIGWAVVMVATALLLMLMPALQFAALIPLAAFAVVWNLATAALLPVALEHPGGFWESFRVGVQVSWANWKKWGLLVVVQLLLLGWIFYYYHSHGGNTNISWSVNVFWTGGFADDCKWYDKLAAVLKVSPLPLVDTLLSLLFGAFAVAIKLAIVQRLQPKPPVLA